MRTGKPERQSPVSAADWNFSRVFLSKYQIHIKGDSYMGRAMWSGNINFGMVTIPVKLHTATASDSIAFHQLHDKCDTRIKELRWCPHCDKRVEWSEIVKGYEYAKNRYVEVTAEDLEKLPLPSKHTIEVANFVDLDEIDPIYFDSTYYIEVEKSAQKPYKLLLNTLAEKGKAGIAKIAFRSKERLCALRPMNGQIVLQTLLYTDEIKSEDEGSKAASVTITAQEKKMADTLIDALSTKFQPEKFKDEYQTALKKLIDAKLKGVDLAEPIQAEQGGTLDLMEALRASVDQLSKGHSKSSKAGEKPATSRSAAKAHKPAAAKSKPRKKRVA